MLEAQAGEGRVRKGRARRQGQSSWQRREAQNTDKALGSQAVKALRLSC